MILLIAHHKGGVGKSTIAVNLAVEFQRRDMDPFILEADPTVHTSTNWARDREEAGGVPVQTLQKTGNLRQTLTDLGDRYGVVIVDAPGKDSREMRTAMTTADMLLAPIEPTQPALDVTEQLAKVIEEARDLNPELKVLAVLNRVPTNTFSKAADQAKQYLAEFPEIRLASVRLHERNAYKEALAEGLGVVEMRDSKAKNEIQRLAEEILAW